MHRNGLRLLKLVNTLLDFSRIEAGRVQASYQPTDLATFTTEIASAFDSAMQNAGLRFSVECLPIADPVYVDRDMWEKIVLNLLSNAYKFTFAGEVVLTLKPVDGAVELQVRDTGVGIPEEHREQVFERFHRIESTQARTLRRHRDRTGAGSGTGETSRRHCARGERGWRRQHIHGDDSARQGASPAERIHAAQSLVSTTIRAEAYVEELRQWLGNEPGVGGRCGDAAKQASLAPVRDPQPRESAN